MNVENTSCNSDALDDYDGWIDEPVNIEQSKKEKRDFSVLSPADIVQRMLTTIEEVNEVAGLDPNVVRTLLNHCKWDKSMLMERLYDNDTEKLFKEAHIVNPYIEKAKIENNTNKNGSSECQICFTDILPAMMTGLECGHQFCEDCWREYLTTKIMTEGVGQSITCAEHKCSIRVDYATVLRLVNDCKVKEKYQNLLINNYVMCTPNMKWCPKAGCSNAIEFEGSQCSAVACECGHEFCFLCSETVHEPIECELLKRWNEKSLYSSSHHWISRKTKDCPKCRITLNKIGGCNYVQCKNETCLYSFCWECMGRVEGHDTLLKANCYKFVGKEKTYIKENVDRKDLERYLHFCDLFNAHKQSLIFETSADGPIGKKIQELHSLTLQRKIREAANILSACRKILMYTYVFEYYVSKDSNVHLFQQNQRNLEMATEELSELLETKITSTNIREFEINLVGKFTYCESHRKILIGHIREGYSKSWWTYDPKLL